MMLIIGWVLSIIGTIITIIGGVLYNEYTVKYYGLYRYYKAADVEASIIVIVVGIILLIAGIMCFLFNYIRKNKVRKLINTIKCLKCNNIVPNSIDFCPRCGNNLKEQYSIPNNTIL